MNIMPGLATTSSALQAEKLRMDIVSQNIANAHTTRGPDGQPYQRQLVQFESAMMDVGRRADGSMATAIGVTVRDVVADQTAGPLVFDPGHPDADEKGMVRLPNVNLTHEMIDLISASRSYEANLNVVRTSKQMAQQALKMGDK